MKTNVLGVKGNQHAGHVLEGFYFYTKEGADAPPRVREMKG